MNPGQIAVSATLFVAVICAGGMWATAQAELDAVHAQQKKLHADLRHWKAIAYRMQDFENQAITEAQTETMQVYQQMQEQLDACRKGQK